jgi:uncharacterized membrane protein (DUF373 family)
VWRRSIETVITKVQKVTVLALEVELIAMARKVILEKPNTVLSLTLFGIAALILALGIAFYFQRQRTAKRGMDFLKQSQANIGSLATAKGASTSQ